MESEPDRNCIGCDGADHEADLCPRLDADGLPARCVKEWSDEKLFYLRNYATIFSKGMRNKWSNRVYLDLFAGPGRYRVKPAGRFENGSPLIALGLPFTHYTSATSPRTSSRRSTSA